MTDIQQNLQRIKKQIPDSVTLVAVSKRQPLDKLQAAYDAGQRDFGENKVQELMDKVEKFPADMRWHFIGHLQTNKVKYIAQFIHLIHSVDSLKVMKEINKQAAKASRKIDVLWQMHIADEESKFGLTSSALEELTAAYLQGSYPNVILRGLMGMATFTENQDQIRSEFGKLKSYFDRLKTQIDTMDTLSMGMSGDLAIALEQGSTMVRIGTDVFGKRTF